MYLKPIPFPSGLLIFPNKNVLISSERHKSEVHLLEKSVLNVAFACMSDALNPKLTGPTGFVFKQKQRANSANTHKHLQGCSIPKSPSASSLLSEFPNHEHFLFQLFYIHMRCSAKEKSTCATSAHIIQSLYVAQSLNRCVFDPLTDLIAGSSDV